jgi:predicted metal-dependent phosphoesterase TrpH
MKEFKADLHCHSTFSDGTFTPEAIIQLAKESQLSGLAITDHESIEAYRTAEPYASSMGIEMISGGEFSALHQGSSVHILGYAFSLASPTIQAFCNKHHQRRTNRNLLILELLKKHGMVITEEEITTHSLDLLPHSIGRPHIALAMIKKGYVATINEAFKKYLAEGKICYAPGESFSVEETLDVIHRAGGLAIIAHPHLINEISVLNKLLDMKFDGIEGYYANFTLEKNQRWIKIADKKGWLLTGGSDFHGTVKPQISLGSSWVPEQTFRILQNHYKSANSSNQTP